MWRKCLAVAVVVQAWAAAGAEAAGQVEGFIHRTVTRIQESEAILSWPMSPYGAGSQFWMDVPGKYREAYLSFPSTQFLPLDDLDGYWKSYSTYGRYQSMLFGYPEGNYTFGFQDSLGKWLEVTYTATAEVPVVDTPVLTNYPALQALVPGQDFSVEWRTDGAFAPELRTEVEIMHLREDGVYPAVYRVSAAGAQPLLPAAGQATIPGGILEPGGRYQLLIRFTQASGQRQTTADGQDWNLYTAARAETQTMLGLAGDAPLDPAIGWQTTFDLGWMTSGSAFLAVWPRFPVSNEIHFLFAPSDWTTIPAEQISVQGPPGSGFEAGTGAYLLIDTDETLWYAITSNSINFPGPGTYTVSYRGKQYPAYADAVPDEARSPIALPAALLDPEGRLMSLRWDYRNPGTGGQLQEAALQALVDQSVSIILDDGSLLLQETGLGPALRELAIPPEQRVQWDNVAMVTVISRLDHNHRTVSRYRLTHIERPLQVYLSEGIADGQWLLVPWLGLIAEVAWPWTWSERHGFLYLGGPGNGEVVAWKPGGGWIYFTPLTYPYAYNYGDELWSVLGVDF